MVQKSKILYLNCIYNGDNYVAHCRYGPCTSVGSNYLWTIHLTIIKKLYSSIILLVIGGLIVRSQVIIGDDCKGMIQALSLIFFCIIYVISLVVILVVQRTRKRPFNPYPFVTTFVVVIATYFTLNVDKFQSEPKLIAVTKAELKSKLTLRADGTFLIQIREIEWSCFYSGKYDLDRDTLRLSRPDIQSVTEDLFVNRYLVDNDEMRLRPLDNADSVSDAARTLIILSNK